MGLSKKLLATFLKIYNLIFRKQKNDAYYGEKEGIFDTTVSITTIKNLLLDTIMSKLTVHENLQFLAKIIRRRRELFGHSRKTAASITGVPAPTIRKFEYSGKISLTQFLMLCQVYGDLNKLSFLFPPLVNGHEHPADVKTDERKESRK
ncbi:helix-turn-helix transcriptional regulator [Porticoccus sp. W117]|uniref:helix-turn-helix domain-containing protein n=1 Tax=Porticoccus sp. W117 TaxID=3054777 RepID=UPI002595FD30|nr:helix-turn-helix transcriptional regulator [Porticoccus sp. W117]MDM3872573.1 helix-turn-helix transcriptional regulator [Porticoccus sp. W117]